LPLAATLQGIAAESVELIWPLFPSNTIASQSGFNKIHAVDGIQADKVGEDKKTPHCAGFKSRTNQSFPLTDVG